MKHCLVFLSDTHLGLKTDGIDRRGEILNIFRHVVSKCAEYDQKGFATRLILGGDIFDDDNPSEDLITLFITIMNWIQDAGIQCDIIVGNHEAISNSRLSCLRFIKEMKSKYSYFTLREKIELTQYGKLYVSYLPHVTKATLASLKTKYESTQDYIDTVGKKIIEKTNGYMHIAFSHLNVKQSRSGSEANLLKKSEAFLPLSYINTPPGFVEPLIINGHIHERQRIGNILIAGSPLFCSFGETQDKTFVSVFIDEEKGEMEVAENETPFVPFIQTEVHMIGNTVEFKDQPVVIALLEKANKYVKSGHNPVVKFQVTINAENNSYDWVAQKKAIEIANPGCKIVPIEPRVVQHRVVRNDKQKANLEPDQAVKVFLKRNLKNEEDRMKRIYKKSKPYLGAAL